VLTRFIGRSRAIARAEPVTVLLLVSANLVPLVGVLYFDWDVFSVLFLYWIENGVVGVLNVPKILLTARNPDHDEGAHVVYRAIAFPLHYGIFWFVHGIAVFALTAGFASSTGTDLGLGVRTALADTGLLLAVIALILSHVANFWFNYVGRREYLRTTPEKQQTEPYPRMVALHVTIVVGGFAIVVLGQPEALIALLVLTKVVLDLGLYIADRERKQTAAPAQEPAAA